MSSQVGAGRSQAHLPRNYVTILEAIHTADPGQHLTAADVFDLARREQPKIGFATVHRGLSRLHELGLVLKVDVPGAASAMYEPSASPHAHFRCLSCGDIRDVEYHVPVDHVATLAAQFGWQIATESITFEGRCRKCVEAAAAD